MSTPEAGRPGLGGSWWRLMARLGLPESRWDALPGWQRRLAKVSVVGLVLTTFGTFFCAEGLGVDWPLGDAGLLVVLAVWLGVSQAAVRVIAGARSERPRTPEVVA